MLTTPQRENKQTFGKTKSASKNPLLDYNQVKVMYAQKISSFHSSYWHFVTGQRAHVHNF